MLNQSGQSVINNDDEKINSASKQFQRLPWSFILDSLPHKDLRALQNTSTSVYQLVLDYRRAKEAQYDTDFLAIIKSCEQELRKPLLMLGTMPFDEIYLSIAIGLLILHPNRWHWRDGTRLKNVLTLLHDRVADFLPKRKITFVNELYKRLLESFPMEHDCWSISEHIQLLIAIEDILHDPFAKTKNNQEKNAIEKNIDERDVHTVINALRIFQERLSSKHDTKEEKKYSLKRRDMIRLFFHTLLTEEGGQTTLRSFCREIEKLTSFQIDEQHTQAKLLTQWIDTLCLYEQHEHAIVLLREIILRCSAPHRPDLRIVNQHLVTLCLKVEHHRQDANRWSIAEQWQQQLKTARLQLKEQIDGLALNNSFQAKQIFEFEAKWSTELHKLAYYLLEITYQFLGVPPQSFSIFTLGSLALKGATPYSDLEYGVVLTSIEDEKSPSYINRFLDCFHVLVELLGEHSIPHVGFHMDIGMHPVPILGGEERLKSTIGTMTTALTSKNYSLKDTINNALQHPRVLFEGVVTYANDNKNTKPFTLFEEFKGAIKIRAEQSYPGFEEHLNWRKARALAHLQGMVEEAKNGNKRGKKGWLFIDTEIIPQRVNIKAGYALIKYWLMDSANFSDLSYETVPQALRQLAKTHLHPEFVIEVEYALAALTLIRYRAQFKAGQQQGQEWVCVSTCAEKQAGDYVLNPEEEKAWQEAYLTVIQPCYLLLEAWGLEQCEWKINAASKNDTIQVIEKFKHINQLDPIVILLKDLIKRFSNSTQFATMTTTVSAFAHTTTLSTTTSTLTTPITTTMESSQLTTQYKRMIQSIAAVTQSRWQREAQPTEHSWMERHYKIYQQLPATLLKEYELCLIQLIEQNKSNSESIDWIPQLAVWHYLENPRHHSVEALKNLHHYLLKCIQQNQFIPEKHWDKLPFEIQESLIEFFEAAHISFNTIFDLRHRLQTNGESYQRQFEQRKWEKGLKTIFISKEQLAAETLSNFALRQLPPIKIHRYDNKKGIQEFYFHPKVIEQLQGQGKLSTTGELAPPKNLPHGRHQILVIDITIKAKRYHLHIKVNPERPGGELMSNRLSWRLGCRAPWVEIMVWVTPKGETIPILVMETIGEGKNLLDEIEANPMPIYQETLTSQLSNATLTRQILRTLIISQSDGKADNYVREKHEYAQGQFEYRLIAIDNERAFWPYRVYLPNQSWLPLCQDIHFVLKAFYSQELDATALTVFTQLDLEQLFNAWLSELGEIDTAFATLFPKEYQNQPVAAKAEWDKKISQQFAGKLLPLLAIPLLQEGLKALVKNWKELQEYVRKNKDNQKPIRGIECLKAIEPSFAAYLQHSRQNTTLLSRFYQLFQWGYHRGKTMPFTQITYQTGEGDLLQYEYNFHQDFNNYQLRIGMYNNNDYFEAFHEWKENIESRYQNEIWIMKKGEIYTAYAIMVQGKCLSITWQRDNKMPITVKNIINRALSLKTIQTILLTPTERTEIFFWLIQQFNLSRLMVWQKTLAQALYIDRVQRVANLLKKMELEKNQEISEMTVKELIQAWSENTETKLWQSFDFGAYPEYFFNAVKNNLLKSNHSVQILFLKNLPKLDIALLWELLKQHPLIHSLDVSYCQDSNLAEQLFKSPSSFQRGIGLLQALGLMRIYASHLYATKFYKYVIKQKIQEKKAFLGIQYLDLSYCPQLTALDCELPQLKVLKLTGNTALQSLQIHYLNNPSLLKKLDLWKCDALAQQWTKKIITDYLDRHPNLIHFWLPSRALLLEYLADAETSDANDIKFLSTQKKADYFNLSVPLELILQPACYVGKAYKITQLQLNELNTYLNSVKSTPSTVPSLMLLTKDDPIPISICCFGVESCDGTEVRDWFVTQESGKPFFGKTMIDPFYIRTYENYRLNFWIHTTKSKYMSSFTSNFSLAQKHIKNSIILVLFIRRKEDLKGINAIIENNYKKFIILIALSTINDNTNVEYFNRENIQNKVESSYLAHKFFFSGCRTMENMDDIYDYIVHAAIFIHQDPFKANYLMENRSAIITEIDYFNIIKTKEKNEKNNIAALATTKSITAEIILQLIQALTNPVIIVQKEVAFILQKFTQEILINDALQYNNPVQDAYNLGVKQSALIHPLVSSKVISGLKLLSNSSIGIIISFLMKVKQLLLTRIEYIYKIFDCLIQMKADPAGWTVLHYAIANYNLHYILISLGHFSSRTIRKIMGTKIAESPFYGNDLLTYLCKNLFTQSYVVQQQIFEILLVCNEQFPEQIEISAALEGCVHYGAEFGSLKDLQLLLGKINNKNIISAKNNLGLTPLHLAVCRNESTEIVHCLLMFGADIYSCDDKGNSVLHKAIEYSTNLSTIRLLLNAGISQHCKNDKGESPLDIARKCNHVEIIKIFQSYKYSISSWLSFFFRPNINIELSLPIKDLNSLSLVNKQSYFFFKPLLTERSSCNLGAIAETSENERAIKNTF